MSKFKEATKECLQYELPEEIKVWLVNEFRAIMKKHTIKRYGDDP